MASPSGKVTLQSASREDLINYIKREKLSKNKLEQAFQGNLSKCCFINKFLTFVTEEKGKNSRIIEILEQNELPATDLDSLNTLLQSNSLKISQLVQSK